MDIELEEERLNFLVIENPVKLEDFVLSIHSAKQKITEDVSIFEKFEKINFAKHVDILFSPMSISYHTKEIQKKLLEYVLEKVQDSYLAEDFIDISGSLVSLCSKIYLELEYDIEYLDYVEVEDILKLMDIRLKEEEGRFVERLIDYSKTMFELLHRNIFILVGCSGFLTKIDFEYLRQHQFSQKILFLFVESHQIDLESPKKQTIIDIDLCEI